jgi:lysophospholipase L1-like esterase
VIDDVDILAQAGVRARRDLKAMRASVIDGYGSSLLQSSDSGTVYVPRLSERFMSRLAAALGNAQERNFGVGSTELIHDGATQGWPLAWKHTVTNLPGSSTGYALKNAGLFRQLCLLKHAFNDWQKKGSDTAMAGTWREGVRAWIEMMRAQYAFQASDAIFSGGLSGWTAQGVNASYGGYFYSRGTAGSVVATLGSTNPGGRFTFYALVKSDERWRGRAKIGAGAYVSTLDATVLGVAGWLTAVCIPVDIPAGATTVTLDIDNVTGGIRFLGATLNATGHGLEPLVVMIGSPATPSMPWNGDATGWTTAHKNTANQTMSDLAASYDARVRFVSLDSLESGGVGRPELFADDVHYDSTGNGEIEELLLAEIARAGIPQNIGSPSRISAASNTWPEWSEPRGKVAIDSAGGVAYFANGIDYTTKVALWVPVGAPVPVTKTADYTLVLQDQGGLIEMNSASAHVVTVPPNSSVAFPIGTSIDLVRYGAGTLTVTPGAGVTIDSPAGVLTVGPQYGRARLYKRATNEWVLTGNLA